MTSHFVRLCLILLIVGLCFNVGLGAKRSKSRSKVDIQLAPHHIRIQHLEVNTHPDLIVDTPTPHFSWQLSDEGGIRGLTQIAYQLIIYPISNGVIQYKDTRYDSGRVESSASTHILHNGPALLPNTHYIVAIKYWSNTGKESLSSTVSFRTALFAQAFPAQASWIGSLALPMNEIRKEFTLPSLNNIASATLWMSGLGYSTLYLNGQIVDPSRRLDPGWTTFEKRSLYVSFNVSANLVSGANAIGIWLGNGWYSQEQYIGGVDEPSYGPPRLLFWLQVVYTNNDQVNVYSDNSWQGRQGPVIHDGVYMGMIHDSRIERDGWSKAGFVDKLSLWVNVSVLPTPLDSTGVLSLQYHDPIRVAPNNIHIATGGATQPPGVVGGDLFKTGGVITPTSVGGCVEGQLFDLGQNIAGWCAIKTHARAGMSMQVRYAETLQLNDMQNAVGIYTQNLRQAGSLDIYIFKDDQTVVFEPEFTVHGFRYLEVRGAKNGIAASDITCYFVHSETTLVGNFTSSNTVMNQIQHNVVWGQLSNLMSLPTDCDQRDERKGWMGDAGLTVDEALYNFDLAPFYYNFLDLIHDAQRKDNGGVGDTVPLTFGSNPGDPNWGTAYPSIVWQLYQHYGDLGIILAHIDGLHAWVENVYTGYNSTGLSGLWYEYGDWVPPPPYGQTNGRLIASFPFLRDVWRVGTLAGLIGRTDIQMEYTALYPKLATEFHKTFYTSDSVGYADGAQTANALALSLPNVVPANLTESVLSALVNDVTSKGHVTTGIVGVAQLFPVLSMNGHHDIALKLAQMTDYPSYGWMFTNSIENATTVWELWDSPREGPSMNSRNHIMFGTVSAWFYRYVAGIDLNGLDEILIRPRMAMDMSLMPYMATEVVTIKGSVSVAYNRDITNNIVLSVTVPSNTHAVIEMEPLLVRGRCISLHESGVELWSELSESSLPSGHRISNNGGLTLSNDVSGIEWLKRDEETQVMSMRVGGGKYEFSAQWM